MTKRTTACRPTCLRSLRNVEQEFAIGGSPHARTSDADTLALFQQQAKMRDREKHVAILHWLTKGGDRTSLMSL
jgi:hypothetical protein